MAVGHRTRLSGETLRRPEFQHEPLVCVVQQQGLSLDARVLERIELGHTEDGRQ